MGTAPAHVRFTPNSDRKSGLLHVCFTPESGHVRCNWECPLWAKSGHACRRLLTLRDLLYRKRPRHRRPKALSRLWCSKADRENKEETERSHFAGGKLMSLLHTYRDYVHSDNPLLSSRQSPITLGASFCSQA